jgi:hypothetical protein
MTTAVLRPYKQKLLRELGSEALFDDQIDKIGLREFGRRWAGVYPSDGLPAVRPNRFYVVNSGFRGGPGAHWVAMYASPSRRIYVYDSFARTSTKIIPATVRKISHEHFVEDANGVADQRGDSQVCGVLSLAWLMAVRDHGIRRALDGPLERVVA